MESEKDKKIHMKCPACGIKTDIKKLSEDEKIYPLGLYSLYDFIGGIDWTIAKYYCEKCGYRW